MNPDELVTIATFDFPQQMAIVKSRLEFEGIKCYTKDEFTVQVHNFYSHAIGGIKLQVKKEDVHDAVVILNETGLNIKVGETENNFWQKIDKATKSIPLLNKQRPELRFIVLSGLVLVIISLGVYYAVQPTLAEKLSNHQWCIDLVVYNSETMHDGHGMCSEQLNFMENGKLLITGLSAYDIQGEWKIKNDNLIIELIDTYPEAFEGTYQIETDNINLELVSKSTALFCFRKNYY